MDRQTLLQLGEHLKESITITAGPRTGMILPQSFTVEGCDHTFQKTTNWLESNALDVEKSLKWIKEHRAECDCTIITNIILRLDEEI